MLSAPSTNTITNGFSNMAAFPRVMSYMIEKFDYTGPLPPWKEPFFFVSFILFYFIFTGIDTYSRYEFVVPACAVQFSLSCV